MRRKKRTDLIARRRWLAAVLPSLLRIGRTKLDAITPEVLEMGSQTSLLNRQTIGAPTLYRTPKWKHGIKEPCSDRTMISRTLPALNDFFHRNRCLERDHSRLDKRAGSPMQTGSFCDWTPVVRSVADRGSSS